MALDKKTIQLMFWAVILVSHLASSGVSLSVELAGKEDSREIIQDEFNGHFSDPSAKAGTGLV